MAIAIGNIIYTNIVTNLPLSVCSRDSCTKHSNNSTRWFGYVNCKTKLRYCIMMLHFTCVMVLEHTLSYSFKLEFRALRRGISCQAPKPTVIRAVSATLQTE